MKKITAFCISILLLICVMGGCANVEKGNDNGKINIVASIFPVYDWVREIAGNSADVTMLIDNGVDPHSFQPSAEDIVKISNCDMFIYTGGESDEWMEDALKEAVNKNMTVVNLLDVLSDDVKREEIVEGMQGEKSGEAENDEHVWLSLKNAELFCGYISGKLGEINKEHKDEYALNTKKYIKRLSAVDRDYKTAVENARIKTLVFADRFPFRYMFDDYGLSYYAAFPGCEADAEASFETITFLAKKIDELKLNSIFQIDGSDGSLARTVKNCTGSKNQEILTLNSMQSVTLEQSEDKTTYLSVMKNNLKILKRALK